MADDAASFRTDIVATSFGLTSSMLPTMPSITTSGEELLSVPMPRMVTAAWSAPGSPDDCMASKPAETP